MKYCNNNDCKWNDRKGLCTSFEFEDDEPRIPEDRECMKDYSKNDKKISPSTSNNY